MLDTDFDGLAAVTSTKLACPPLGVGRDPSPAASTGEGVAPSRGRHHRTR